MNVDNIISLNSHHGRRRGKEGGGQEKYILSLPAGIYQSSSKSQIDRCVDS